MPLKKIHFSISERKLFLRTFDIAMVLLGLLLLNYFIDFEYFNFKNPDSTLWFVVLTIYLLFFGQIFELYDLKVASDIYLTLRSLTLTVAFTVLVYVFTPLISPEFPTYRLQILYFTIILFVAVLLNRLFYIKFIFSPRFFKSILLIAEPNIFNKVQAIIKNRGNYKLEVCLSNEAINDIENTKIYSLNNANLKQILKDHFITEIIVSSNDINFIPTSLNKQLIELFEEGKVIKTVDNFIEEETNSISETQLKPNFYNYFTFSKNHQNNLYLAFRRIIDIVISIFGILFFLIVALFVLFGNAIANKGSLLYRQKRVGKKGKEFTMVKFRTMISNAEENGVAWAVKNDYRITPFGKFLRKTRLDEVPQFINVFKGEMSIIGPRPERPEFVKSLEKELPFYAIRHVIKPGLTGWAQVMLPYASSVDDQHKKLMYDLYYIKERNSLLDFKIVIKTISTILFFRGT